jgi:hypothetical protein
VWKIKINGETLREKPIHKLIKLNKDLYNPDVYKRFERFSERFIDDKLSDDEKLPVDAYYPTQDFHDIITELTAQIPSEFSSTGTESDFIRKSLIEGSHLKQILHKIYMENLLGINAYVMLRPKLSSDADKFVIFDMDIIPSENVWVEYDIFTDNVKKITTQEKRTTYINGDEEVKYLYTRVYTMDKIETYFRAISGERLPDMVDKIEENPFEKYGMLPVVEFKGYSENEKPLASKLIEPQLQLDNLNTNIENLINMHSNPVYVIQNTMRDWSDATFGAGEIVGLEGEEEFKPTTADMQLQYLDNHRNYKRDDIYKTGGLTTPTLRERMYGTDSSAVTKVASSEFIATARIITAYAKKSLNKIAKLLLEINGKELTDESLIPPVEILPYDLEKVFNTGTLGLNLGLIDDEWIWSRYMPELSNREKEKIRSFFASRQDLTKDNTNVNNNALQTKAIGNKEQLNTSKEDIDGKVTKS